MDRRLEKIIKYFRENAIATSVATGAVAGLPPDSPPVHKKKKKKGMERTTAQVDGTYRTVWVTILLSICWGERGEI